MVVVIIGVVMNGVQKTDHDVDGNQDHCDNDAANEDNDYEGKNQIEEEERMPTMMITKMIIMLKKYILVVMEVTTKTLLKMVMGLKQFTALML